MLQLAAVTRVGRRRDVSHGRGGVGEVGEGRGGVRGELRRMVGGRDRLLERDWREVTWLAALLDRVSLRSYPYFAR